MIDPGIFQPPGAVQPLTEVEQLRARVLELEAQVERLGSALAREQSDRNWEEQARRGGTM